MFDPKRLHEIADGTVAAAVCTVVATSGSTPRKIGASMVVFSPAPGDDSSGRIEGTIGGGAVEHRVQAEALEAIACMRPRTVEVALTTQLGMCCGGQMTIFIEPVRQSPPLLLFGAGHVAAALCPAASAAGFRVYVADPRDEQRTPTRFPDAARLVEDYEDADLDTLPFGPDAFALIVTHDHGTDQRLTERLLKRELRYLGVLGSQRKARLTRERCLAKGFSPAEVARIVSPAGLAIGAETPEEIAISILAQLIAIRRGAEQSVSAEPQSAAS